MQIHHSAGIYDVIDVPGGYAVRKLGGKMFPARATLADAIGQADAYRDEDEGNAREEMACRIADQDALVDEACR